MKYFVFGFFYPSLFLFVFSMFFNVHHKFDVLKDSTSRSVSEDSRIDCFRTLSVLLSDEFPKGLTKKQRFFNMFKRKANNFKEKFKLHKAYKIDYDLYVWYRDEFTEILETQDYVPAKYLSSKPEALLAFVQAINKKNFINMDEKVKKLSLKKRKVFQRRRIHKMFEQINSGAEWSLTKMEDVVGDLIYETIGPEARIFAGEVFDDKETLSRHLIKIFLEEVTYQGLKKSFANNNIFPGRMGRMAKFFESGPASMIVMGAMWSPLLFKGLPLPYLPRLAKLKISKELTEELMNGRVSKEVLEKLDKEFKEELNLNFFQKHSSRAVYNEFRKRLNSYAIPAIVSWYFLSDLWSHNENMEIYDKQISYMDTKIESLVNIYVTLTQFDDVSIHILNSVGKVKMSTGANTDEDTKNEEVRKVMGNHICRDLIDCYEAQSMELGVEVLDKENAEHIESLNECREEYDPSQNRQCPEL